jgi:hypothetical protein
MTTRILRRREELRSLACPTTNDLIFNQSWSMHGACSHPHPSSVNSRASKQYSLQNSSWSSTTHLQLSCAHLVCFDISYPPTFSRLLIFDTLSSFLQPQNIGRWHDQSFKTLLRNSFLWCAVIPKLPPIRKWYVGHQSAGFRKE